MRVMRPIALIALAVLTAAPLAAQQAAPAAPSGALRAPLSTRVVFTMPLAPARVQGQPAPTPKNVSIEYGQPHARGRNVPTELNTDGTVWRTGANSSTTLRTETALVIGGADVPAGNYSLYTIRQNGQYFLIINNNTGQWGTEYDATKDLVRVPLRSRQRSEAQESLQIVMVPADNQSARGVLTISWGRLELSADWSAK
ncbi:MAG: hypothetical protein C0503_00980 [Gemmatimonas sp.]|nr:hypothetical protein [Gemmatimonas sp.]